MNAKVITIMVLILIAVIVMLQNTENTILKVLFWKIMIPRILLLVILLLIGFAIGYVAANLIGGKTGDA
jgi:hypothetical protein